LWGVFVWGTDVWGQRDVEWTDYKNISNTMSVSSTRTFKVAHQVSENVFFDTIISRQYSYKISENLNVNGIRIADINSHTMNGQLDVEKDAWVFNIQADITTTPMLGVLTEMGASEKEVYYFVSNPLVKQYKKLKLENKIKLSSQHLVNCISSINQRCHDVTL
jgi:hypothetical protein